MEPLTEEEKAEVESHVGLVNIIVDKYFFHLPKCVGRDDLVQNGIVGVIAAVKNKQKFPKEKFNSYLINQIKWRIADGLRKSHPVGRCGKGKIKMVKLKEDARQAVLPELIITDTSLHQVDVDDEMDFLLRHLYSNQRKVFELKRKGYVIGEICKILNITTSRYDYLMFNGRHLIRQQVSHAA